MRYWWVNQNQTFRQEIEGGYLWSPKRNANGARNPFYEFMRSVAPGDLILSFADTRIQAIGMARSPAYECPKPPEFGKTGPNWDFIGWRVDVRWQRLSNRIRPVEHIDRLRPHLPERYAPLQSTGRGLQGVYLTAVSPPLMSEIAELIGREAKDLVQANRTLDEIGSYGEGLLEWEDYLVGQVERTPGLDETEKRQLILARRGQGRFKENVQRLEHACRLTGVERLEHLRASHIKPWRDAPNDERLDGENGLLLTPNADHLFDRGFISFEDDGRLLVSRIAHEDSLRRMGIPMSGRLSVGPFSEGQRRYLDFHRDEVFLESSARAAWEA